MSVPHGQRREFVAVALAVLAFVVLMGFALSRLVEIERDTHSSSGEGIVWALAQTQYEIQRLLLATTPGRHATPDQIDLRVDMVLSRLALLQDGPMAARIAEAGRAGVVARAAADLLALEPLIAGSGDRVERYSLRLARTMGQYLEPLGSIANQLMIENRIEDGERRSGYTSSIIQVIVSILGIMATGGFLIARLVRSLGLAAAAEAQVRREKNFLDSLLESSGEGIAAFDAQMRCTHWNEGMTRLFGVAPATMLGADLPGADGMLTVAILADVLRGEPLYLPAQLGDGGTYLERVLSPIRLNGTVTGGIVIVRDVTERYDAQRERQLREVYRDFVTMVSHQFRTPLAIIDSTVQRMVRRGSRMDAAELVDRAEIIRGAAAGLARLMDSTLTTERLDAGEVELSLRVTDLAQLGRDVCRRFTELSPERAIIADLGALTEPVACDAMLIDQALSNLVGNALKYSPADRPVEVTASQDEAAATISVADHGVGIPPDEQGRIFERFFRASTAAGIAGNGIGLYTARQIVKLHGGDIAIATGASGGAVFTLRLPRLSPSGALP
jgi:signal transduction histidine kinase